MARGWESKDVESQIEALEEARQTRPVLTIEEAALMRKRESLELHRVRVLGDIQRACNPRHKDQLFGALHHLEAELAKLRPPAVPEV